MKPYRLLKKTNETVKPTKRKKPKKGVEWEEPAWLDEILDSLGEKIMMDEMRKNNSIFSRN